MILSISELRAREVIRICDAETIGCVSDVTFDTCTGKLCALCVVPNGCGPGGLWRGDTISISWDRIRCIGGDCILVDLGRDECCICAGHRKRFWKFKCK